MDVEFTTATWVPTAQFITATWDVRGRGKGGPRQLLHLLGAEHV
jgi:hypothetical protein